MTENNQQSKKKKTKTLKRTVKRILFFLIFLVIAVFIYCFFSYYRQSQSIDEKIAEIVAARAIPDSQNAATIYNQLIEDSKEYKFPVEFMDPNSEYLTRIKPWSKDDYPELADWLETQQDTIAKLLEASKFVKCYFPVNTNLDTYGDNMDHIAKMRQWAFLLVLAANNDVAQGKMDLALQKYISVIRIGRHECQQPVVIDYLVGMAVEQIALRAIARFIIEDNPSESLLSRIEKIKLPTKQQWAIESGPMFRMERLIEQKWNRRLGLFGRIRVWWMFRKVFNQNEYGTEDSYRRLYLRLLAHRRGNRILIAIKRYKNKHDTWPKTLDDVKEHVSSEVLIDPISNKSFIYKLTADSFMLYSKGENCIDENGKRDKLYQEKTGADDWRIWPSYVIRGKKAMGNTNDK
jgi:hypothetical protein